MLLQVRVPGLLHRCQAITKGFFTPPENLIRYQVETFEGLPQKVLLHSILVSQDTIHYYYKAKLHDSVDTNIVQTHPRNPHFLRQGEVVRCESVVQERHSQLQAERERHKMSLN